jgi:hypothetical protein
MLHFILKTKIIDLDILACDTNLELFNNLINNNILIDRWSYFDICCETGQMNLAKLIYDKSINDKLINHNINHNFNSCLYNACTGGHFKIAKWLAKIINNVDIINNSDCKYIFIKTCEEGHLNIAKWLHKTFNNINIHALGDYAFRWSVSKGHNTVAKWLYSLDNTINLHSMNNYAFNAICSIGNLRMAKWFDNLDDYNNLSSNGYQCFKIACINNNHSTAAWIHSITGNQIFNHVSLSNIFANVCKLGHIRIAKWLLKIKTFDITNLGDVAFNGACIKGNYEIARWLYKKVKSLNIFDHALYEICAAGHFKIIKWLNNIKKIPKKISHVSKNIFINSCNSRNMDMCNWIYDITKDKLEQSDYNEGFIKACISGSCEIVDWVYNLSNSIEITSNNHEAFIISCRKNNILVAEWLISHCDMYYAEICDGLIINFKTNHHLYKALDAMNANNMIEFSKFFPNICYDDTIDNNCCICISDKNMMGRLNCDHIFCIECVLHWFISNNLDTQSNCALCRKTYKLEDVMVSILAS